MKSSIIKIAPIAAALLLSTSLSLAVENKPETSAKTISGPKTTEDSAKAKDAKTTAKVKRVDINSAGKRELKTLPGIGDAEADKIIVGRPYLVKAHLVTHNILSRSVYEDLKARVIAVQKPEYLANPGKK